MLTPEQILKRYQAGHVTETGLMLDVLRLTDDRDVIQALEMLPEDVLNELREFVGYYTPRTRVFPGPRPNPQTVRFVKDWFVTGRGAPSSARRARMAKANYHPTMVKKAAKDGDV
jgi:hypothetical protein